MPALPVYSAPALPIGCRDSAYSSKLGRAYPVRTDVISEPESDAIPTRRRPYIKLAPVG